MKDGWSWFTLDEDGGALVGESRLLGLGRLAFFWTHKKESEWLGFAFSLPSGVKVDLAPTF